MNPARLGSGLHVSHARARTPRWRRGGRRRGRVGLSVLALGTQPSPSPGSWSGGGGGGVYEPMRRGGGRKMQLPQQRPGDRVSGGAPRESSHDRLSILQAEALRARVSALAQPRAKPGPETGRTRHPETPGTKAASRRPHPPVPTRGQGESARRRGWAAAGPSSGRKKPSLRPMGAWQGQKSSAAL